MIIDVFSLFCGLAVMAYAATANRNAAWCWWLAGFLLGALAINPGVLGLPLAPWLGFDATQFAMLILLVSCWVVNNYRRSSIPVLMAGLLTVIWISTLGLQGLPTAAAVLYCGGASLFCLWASLHKPGFSSRRLEDEANMIVLGVALTLIIVPATLSGWESAVTLQDRDASLQTYRENVPVVLLIGAFFIILGGFYSTWKHR